MERLVRVLACLAEGLGIRATARVVEVAPNPVLHGLADAAEPLRAWTSAWLWERPLRPRPLAALEAVWRGGNDGAIRDAKALKRLERARPWVWTASDPESQLSPRCGGPGRQRWRPD